MASSSLSTAPTVTQGPVALPLFKFSHCTSPNPQAKMIWTHLPQRSDMFAVFDVIRKVGTGMVASETKVLKLVRGGELLVCIFSRIFQTEHSSHLSSRSKLSSTTSKTKFAWTRNALYPNTYQTTFSVFLSSSRDHFLLYAIPYLMGKYARRR